MKDPSQFVSEANELITLGDDSVTISEMITYYKTAINILEKSSIVCAAELVAKYRLALAYRDANHPDLAKKIEDDAITKAKHLLDKVDFFESNNNLSEMIYKLCNLPKYDHLNPKGSRLEFPGKCNNGIHLNPEDVKSNLKEKGLINDPTNDTDIATTNVDEDEDDSVS